MDVLSDVLQLIRLNGALFLHAELREPWCVEAPRSSDLALGLAPLPRHMAICHMVLEGRCWAQLHGDAAVPLHAGDVVTFPHGDSHLLGSGLQHAPVSIDHIVRVKVPELTCLRYGGDGERSVIACGWFAYERDVANPLLASLPRLFRSSVRKRASGAWLEQSVRYIVHEAASQQPGSNAVASKVAESLFIEALRDYIESLPAQQTGWLSGLRDPQVGKCLALMHAEPARAWTVDSLAQLVNTSRSVLAERFSALVGDSPMAYLKRWRLAVAARLLCNERSSLIRIAEAVGYESEASFSRAFKTEYGMAPGAWRHGSAARQAAPAPSA
jgi:AraC family transcriptional regulator, alkane utilization regulator